MQDGFLNFVGPCGLYPSAQPAGKNNAISRARRPGAAVGSGFSSCRKGPTEMVRRYGEADASVHDASNSWSRAGEQQADLPLRLRREPMSAEFGDPFSLFQDDARVVLGQRAGRFALVEHARVRPVGDTQAAIAAFRIAHDVPPLAAVDVAVPVGKWRVVGVGIAVVPRTEDVSDFMGN